MNISDYYSKFGFICTPLNDKVPIIKKWNTYTTTKQIDLNKYNIGVLTGKSSNITVLDIDIKDNGLLLWKRLISLYPDINTPIVKTPSGGLHYYFLYTDIKSFSKIKIKNKKIGWDLLNDGRQAVLPPSISKTNKKKYKWIQDIETVKIQKIPEWLYNYLTIYNN